MHESKHDLNTIKIIYSESVQISKYSPYKGYYIIADV